MKELGSIEVTVTRITYGFDESDFEKEGVNEHCIKGERTVVKWMAKSITTSMSPPI